MSVPPFRLYIPTRGRVGRQKTLANLPSRYHPLVTLVCPKEEVSDLRTYGVDVLAQPSSITTISKKREFIFKHAKKEGHSFYMADDDLLIYGLTNGHASRELQAREEGFLKFFSILGTESQVVCAGTKAFSHSHLLKNPPYKYNSHLGFLFGMTLEAADSIEWGRIALFEDIDYTLQLLTSGHHNIVSYDVLVQQNDVTPTTKGGLAGQRTLDLIRSAADQLVEYFPKYVSLKENTTASHPMNIVNVSWRKAAVAGGCYPHTTSTKSLF